MSVKAPWWMLAAVLLLTVAGFMSASTLQLRLNFVDMLPNEHEEVLRYSRLWTNMAKR